VLVDYSSGNLEQCWQVNQAIYYRDAASYDSQRVDMGWTRYQAIRNEHYKLVHNHALDYDPLSDDGVDLYSVEFYRVDQAQAPSLDRAADELLAQAGGVDGLSEEERRNYEALNSELAAILASKPGCPGDGNNDGRIDRRDLHNIEALMRSGWSGSSWYDFNHDAITDLADRSIVLSNLGQSCAP